jgi:maltose alpha-D-glucosyltransferase/alpha-amylase
VAARQFTAKPRSGAPDIGGLLEDWRVRVQAEFRTAYRDAIRGCGVWPRDEAEVERLLKLATIERLLYEIRYELSHRPELVTVPLADLTALIEP